MGLLTALYVYFIFVPKMLLMNLFQRFIKYTPKRFEKVIQENEFFKQSKNQEWMSNWMASNRFLKCVLRTAKIQVSNLKMHDYYYYSVSDVVSG